MIDDKDVKKIIEAMEEVFPTAKMMKDSFDSIENRMATKVEMAGEFKKVNNKLDSVVEKHEGEIKSLQGRVKVLEEALEIE